MMRVALLLVVGLVGLAGASIVSVPSGESAVVRRLGRVLPKPWGPGLHVRLPFGWDRIDRIRLDEVRRIEIGLAGVAGPTDDPGAGEYLTGDWNLLHARAVVQYRISDPAAFLLNVDDRETTLSRLAESGLARSLAHKEIDGALRDGRAAIANEVQTDLEKTLRDYRLGVMILGVSLTDSRPPVEVQPDFAAAQAARSDRDRKATEAKSRAETVLIAAKADARTIEESARAGSTRSIDAANARATRFLALLLETERSRRLSVRRLYMDAIGELLPKVRRKILLTPQESVDLSVFGVEK